jgi:polyhydroxyalkanoate synthesis regulator phasin
MKDKRTYTKHKEHGEDISHENEIVIDFKQAQTDDTINKLRNNVRDLLSMNTQYKTELADQIIKINKLEQEVTDLKKERSDYYNVS